MMTQSRAHRASSRLARRRGSILLMVVGVLTIVAMLGGTFLLVSHLDSSSSKSTLSKSQTDPVIGGVVSRIQYLLAQDRWCNGTAYGNVGNTAGDLTKFIDYPGIDKWLSSSTYCSDLYTPQWVATPAQPYSIGDVVWYNNQLYKCKTAGTTQDPTTADWQSVPQTPADTDGDGAPDAYFADLGVKDPSGNPIYVAVKIQDASGMINVNTAGNGVPGEYDPALPAMPDQVNLVTYLCPPPSPNIGLVNLALRKARGGGPMGVPVMDYTREAGLHPLSPLSGPNKTYMPFAIGDEAYLRWTSGTADMGRLCALCAPPAVVNQAKRQTMTTWNASPVYLRHQTPAAPPVPADITRLAMWKLNVTPAPPAPGPITACSIDADTTFTDSTPVGIAARTALYTKLANTLGAGNERLAAHVVANLWAYCSDSTAPNYPEMTFRCDFADLSNNTFTTYGAIEQLVISEVLVWERSSLIPPAPVDPQAGWCMAVEIYNPTSTPVNTSHYELRTYSGTTLVAKQALPVQSVPAGGRLVFRTLGGTMSDNITPPQDSDFNIAGTIVSAPLLQTAHTDTIKLVRAFYSDPPANTTETDVIPLDQVSPSGDLGYTRPPAPPVPVAPATSSSTESGKLGLRDDTGQRALVAAYKTPVPDVTATSKNAMFNNPKGLTDTDIPLTTVYHGFTLSVPHKKPLGVGELGNILFVGPESGGTGIPQQLFSTYAADPGRGRVDFSGRVSANATYPDVPWADMLSEFIDFVPADTTRTGVSPRVYGRININTASKEVLRQLPWPGSVAVGAGSMQLNDNSPLGNANLSNMLDFIIAYRDKTAYPSAGPAVRTFGTDRLASTPSGTLRASTNTKGFLTPGELAVALNDYMNIQLGWPVYTAAAPANVTAATYLDQRNALYNAVSNLITVNSDVFTANVLVELRDKNGVNPPRRWRYVIVFDRGNCQAAVDRPAILMMTEVN